MRNFLKTFLILIIIVIVTICSVNIFINIFQEYEINKKSKSVDTSNPQDTYEFCLYLREKDNSRYILKYFELMFSNMDLYNYLLENNFNENDAKNTVNSLYFKYMLAANNVKDKESTEEIIKCYLPKICFEKTVSNEDNVISELESQCLKEWGQHFGPVEYFKAIQFFDCIFIAVEDANIDSKNKSDFFFFLAEKYGALGDVEKSLLCSQKSKILGGKQ